MGLYQDALTPSKPIWKTAVTLVVRWLRPLLSPDVSIKDLPNSIGSPLDLSTLLLVLLDRSSIIAVPDSLSTDIEYGKVRGLSVDKKLFNFSVILEQTGKSGSLNLDLYESKLGKCRINTLNILKESDDSTLDEDEKSGDRKLNLQGSMHPSWATSFYGAPYLLAKVIIKRMEMEIQNKTISQLQVVPPSRTPQKDVAPAFVAEIGGIDFNQYRSNPVNIVAAKRSDPDQDLGDYFLLMQTLKFITRTIEFAFLRYSVIPVLCDTVYRTDSFDRVRGPNTTEIFDIIRQWTRGETPSVILPVPSWSRPWTTGFKHKPNARVRWARRKLGSGVHLRWRAWLKQTDWPSKDLTSLLV